MNRLLYSLIVFPFSLLPLKCLMVLRPLLFVVLYQLVGYRKKVVLLNLTRSFPSETPAQIKEKAKAFYWHLSTVFIEAVKNLSFSADALRSRITYTNPALIHELHAKGKNILLVGGHYGNWEWIARRLAAEPSIQFWFVYKPLGRPWAERWLRRWRERQGLVPVPIKEVRPRLKQFFENDSLATPVALYLGADQSPTPHSRWIVGTFLGQRTLMYQGPEELSRAYGLRPVFVGIEPLEGGKYRVRLEEAPQGWELEPSGFLMQWYMDRLSQQIFRAPSYWLWSHRRWKLDGLETQTPTT